MLRLNDYSSSADLGEMDGEEDFTFPPAERRIVTQPLDLSVQTLSEQWNNKILLLPDIQREYLWDNGKASRLIESLILNIPIPVLYFAETREARYEIIDGHQRVRSIIRYINNEFSLVGMAVLREYKGLRFHQLPEREQRFFKMRTLRIILISIESHPNMKFEIYERLNTGAILLNAQELRNSVYRGSFNGLLRYTPSPVSREKNLNMSSSSTMRLLGDFVPMIPRKVDCRASSWLRNAPAEDIEVMRVKFNQTITMVSALLGHAAFRITDPSGHRIEPAVNRALFDAQMLASAWITADVRDIDKQAVRRELASLFGDETFLDAIQRATGDRARTLKRVRETVLALKRAGVPLDVPTDLSR